VKKIYPNRRAVVRIQAGIAGLISKKPCDAPKWCRLCDECAQKVGKMIDRRLDAAKCNPLHFYRVEQILISPAASTSLLTRRCAWSSRGSPSFDCLPSGCRGVHWCLSCHGLVAINATATGLCVRKSRAQARLVGDHFHSKER